VPAKQRRELTPREERFCQLVGARLMEPGPAMLEVGFARGTLASKGPRYLLSRPHVRERIQEVQNEMAGQAVSTLQDVFLMIRDDLEVAFQVERSLMKGARSETVRERAARTVIECGKGLLIASLPGKKAFEEALRDAWSRAQARLQAGEIVEIEGDLVAHTDGGKPAGRA